LARPLRGLVVAWALRERPWPLPAAGPGETAFDAWIRVGRDGVITVSVPQLEMGQGIATLLAQIAAVEIGADWRQMGVVFAPVSEIFANAPLARAGRNCGCRWRGTMAFP
jgi:isoquinoline 1-oxidoreductase beta subunit